MKKVRDWIERMWMVGMGDELGRDDRGIDLNRYQQEIAKEKVQDVNMRQDD